MKLLQALGKTHVLAQVQRARWPYSFSLALEFKPSDLWRGAYFDQKPLYQRAEYILVTGGIASVVYHWSEIPKYRHLAEFPEGQQIDVWVCLVWCFPIHLMIRRPCKNNQP